MLIIMHGLFFCEGGGALALNVATWRCQVKVRAGNRGHCASTVLGGQACKNGCIAPGKGEIAAQHHDNHRDSRSDQGAPWRCTGRRAGCARIVRLTRWPWFTALWSGLGIESRRRCCSSSPLLPCAQPCWDPAPGSTKAAASSPPLRTPSRCCSVPACAPTPAAP